MQPKKEPPYYLLIIGLMLFVIATSLVLGSNIASISVTNIVAIGYSNVSPLHTSGQYIYNSSGARVNLYAAHFQHGGSNQGIALSDIQKVKAMGFNTIRIDVYWGDIQTSATDETYVDPTYFSKHFPSFQVASMDEIVGWCVQENLYVIFVMYWSEWHLPPAWSFPGISRTGMGEGIPAMYEYLLDSRGIKERTGMAAVWTAVANRYQNVPNVIFETLNEPVLEAGKYNYAGTFYQQFNVQMISAIEAGEAGGVTHLKLVQLMLDNQASWTEIVDPVVIFDIPKTNQVWTSHTYTPMANWNPNAVQWADAFTLNSNVLHELYLQGKLTALTAGMENGDGKLDYSPGNYSAMTRSQALYVAWRLARMADAIHTWGKPWLDTEFGKDYSQAAVDVWLNISCGVKRDYSITGWTYFCYCSNTYTGTSTDAYNINRPATQAVVLPVLTPWMIQP